MKIVIFGASGTIGQRIVNEALSRGHEVLAVVRNPAKVTLSNPKLQVQTGDATSAESVASVVAGADAVVSAIGPDHGGTEDTLSRAAKSLVAGLQQAGITRLLVVGGAGSLEVAPGLELVDTPDFPAAWRGVALAHRYALEAYRDADLDWTYISPAALIEPGERTGAYRLGGDQLLTDANGVSRITAEDYAIALLDQVEQPTALRKRITVAY